MSNAFEMVTSDVLTPRYRLFENDGGGFPCPLVSYGGVSIPLRT